MRIAKYISNSGYCSRRDAEIIILKNKVYINDKLCKKLSTKVSEEDIIKISNKIIYLEKKLRLWKLYKPIKTICTNKDPKKRKTIFDILPNNMPRVVSIGRLDFMSEGLILLTNNGEFSRKMELPINNLARIYRVYIIGKINNIIINKINSGISIKGIHYKKIKVKIQKSGKKNSILIFELNEGKNREIRNICQYFKWSIIKLIRIQYGSYKLINQKPGEVIEVKKIAEEFL